MAQFEVRYLISRPGAGGYARYYWQPSKQLRMKGWSSVRLPRSRAKAIAAAEALNARLENWYAEQPGKTAAPVGTVDAFIRLYKNSKEFCDLALKSKENYNCGMRYISEWVGDKPILSITSMSIQHEYDKVQKVTQSKANLIIPLLNIIFDFACRRDFLDSNPARVIRTHKGKRRQTIWTETLVERFVEKADRMGYTKGTY